MVECRVNGRRYYRQTESIEMDAERSILYINIVVIDASEAIAARVRPRVDFFHLPKPLRRVVTAAATGIAGHVFTLHKIAKKVSKKICLTLPEKCFARGITAVIEEVFREGPYVVFQLEVKRVDLATLTEKQAERQLDKDLKAGRDDDDDDDDNSTSSKQHTDKGHIHDKKKKSEGDTKAKELEKQRKKEDKAKAKEAKELEKQRKREDENINIHTDTGTHDIDTDITTTTVDNAMTMATIKPQHMKRWLLYWSKQCLSWFLYWLEQFLKCIGASHQRELEEDVLPALILGKLEEIVGKILAEKIEEKFVDAETNVCSAASQARFFFDTIKEIRQVAEKDEKED